MTSRRRFVQGQSVRSGLSHGYSIEPLEPRTLLSAVDLDTAFGVAGKAQHVFLGNGNETLNAAAVQSDGKLVVAGTAIGYGAAEYGLVARFNTNGALDTTFGNGGIVLMTGSTRSELRSVALQADGKIVVAGDIYTSPTNTEFFAARLSTTGSMDTSFNGTGAVTVSFNQGYDSAYAVKVQSDGKLVLGGRSGTSSGDMQSAVARLTSAGALDSTFGTGGKTVLALDTSATNATSEIRSIAIDSAGRVVAGAILHNVFAGEALVRFNTNGTPDTSFATSGIYKNALPQPDSINVAIQSDGKIITGGTSQGKFFVFRVSAAGADDASFALNGRYSSPSVDGTCATMGIISNGDIVLIGGTSGTTATGSVGELRLTSAGVVDSTFNGSGRATIGGTINIGSGVVRSTGAADVVGRIPSTCSISVLQATAAGALDTSFNLTGQKTLNVPVQIAPAFEREALQPDGKLVVAATVYANYDYSYTGPGVSELTGGQIDVVRYNTNGSLDTTFGTAGVVNISRGLALKVTGLEISSTGDIVVAGSSIDTTIQSHGLLKFLLPTGAPDTSIGASGEVTIAAFSTQPTSDYTALTTAPGGDLLLASTFIDPRAGTATYAIAEMLPNGTLDSRFGSGGVVNTSIDAAYIAGDSAGRVITAGYRSLVRFTPTGQPDATFHFPVATNDLAPVAGLRGLAIEPGGGILVLANSGAAGLEEFAADGTIKSYLQHDSHVTLNAISLLADGSVVTAGSIPQDLGYAAYIGEFFKYVTPFEEYRLGPVLQTTFGEVTTVAAVFSDVVTRADGRILAAGDEAQSQLIAQFIGTVDVINATAGNDTITLSQNADFQSIDWTLGNTKGNLAIMDPSGLTINGNGGSDTITLVNTNGNPLPNNLHLNGTFTINGLIGSNPLAKTNLDIGRGPIYISYASPAVDPITTLRGYLKNGYAGGLWNGTPTSTTGVISSAVAAADATHSSGIGYADSVDGVVPLPANTIELKYTLCGDTGLAGSVGFTDFMRMTQHYTQATGATWGRGDFNYDGAANAADFAMLQPNYGLTLPAPAPTPATALARPARVAALPPPAATLGDSVATAPASTKDSAKHLKAKRARRRWS